MMDEYTIVLMRAPFAYVAQYYDLGEGGYVDVEDWNIREDKGLPPRVVIASEEDGDYYITKDVRAGGVYPASNFIRSPNSDVGWDVLEAFAGQIGYASAFGRHKEIYCGGSQTWEPALAPVNKSRELWRSPINTDFVVRTLERGEVEVVYVNEPHEIITSFEYGGSSDNGM